MAGESPYDGRSIETAIVLSQVDLGQTVNEQYRHLGRLFGTSLSDWYPIGRVVISRGDRTYEKIEVQVGKQIREIYFDITAAQSG